MKADRGTGDFSPVFFFANKQHQIPTKKTGKYRCYDFKKSDIFCKSTQTALQQLRRHHTRRRKANFFSRFFLMNFIRGLSKVVNVILAVIIIAMILIGGSVGIMRVMGMKPYIVLSGSMEPTIHTGGIVVIDTRQKDNVQPQDIVAFAESNGTVVTHRIIGGSKEEGFITKGDANDVEDLNGLPAENIIGKYCFSIPYIGYIWSSLMGNTAVAGKAIPTLLVRLVLPLICLCIISFALDALCSDE